MKSFDQESHNEFEEMGLAHLLSFEASGFFFKASNEDQAALLRFLLVLIFY